MFACLECTGKKYVAEVKKWKIFSGQKNIGRISVNSLYNTVKLGWVKLVGTVSASLTHRWVRVKPGMTIFKGVHM